MSLGLVSYEDSDESDNEPEISSSDSGNKTLPKPDNLTSSSKDSLAKDDKNSEQTEDLGRISDEDETLHSTNSDDLGHIHLPESRVGLSLLNTDIDVKRLTSGNKKSGPVKITIPSLTEVEEDIEEPLKKKIKPSQKGSGLFALLPNPKNSLVPQAVANRSKAMNSKQIPAAKPKPSKSVGKPLVTSRPLTSALISFEDSGDEEESAGTVDFFSLDDKEDDVTPAPVDIDLNLPQASQPAEQKASKKVASDEALSFNKGFQPSKWLAAQTSHTAGYTSHAAGHTSHIPQPELANASQSASKFNYSTSEFMSVSSSDLALDQEAMQQLCGRRDRLKMGEVSLIDVSGDAIMPDSREWLTKQLTEEPVHRPSHKRKEGPTSQQKRKHQITYLAYQAKENELELKNQWANNRMSRKQTQAKYGF